MRVVRVHASITYAQAHARIITCACTDATNSLQSTAEVVAAANAALAAAYIKTGVVPLDLDATDVRRGLG